MQYREQLIDSLISTIVRRQQELGGKRTLLVGISGIDASGKGFVTARLADELKRLGLRVAEINVDGWLNLPDVRFSAHEPGRHFFEHAIRFDEMFAQLVTPLVHHCSIDLEADFAEETAIRYRKHRYLFQGIDVVLLEGIFLLKHELREKYDLTLWIDCSFETALQRAVERRQEGLPSPETIQAFESIYFPAQRIHFERDDPRGAADFIIENNL